MASVCFYLQMHQPPRLRRYSVFDTASDYFDELDNAQTIRKIAGKSYLPVTDLLLDLIQQQQGDFRFALSLTGCVVEQLQRHVPEVLDGIRALAHTGCCELLSETYFHSLAFLYSRDEFRQQVEMHTDLIEELFGQRPTVFRNTELIYSNELATCVGDFDRYRGILTEGVDRLLKDRSPNQLYRPPDRDDLALLLKNYRLSDDIAFRFSDHRWPQWPLTAQKFASWIEPSNPTGALCNLFMDIETFGEHQWRDTGIFEFLSALPTHVLTAGNEFKTPTECIESFPAVNEYDVPKVISWADTERDLSAWAGNPMQSNALHQLYAIERSVKESGDQQILHDWRNLTTSDHFYYMCTKYAADQEVHRYFNPYESPYDSYINFMNVLDNLRSRVDAPEPVA